MELANDPPLHPDVAPISFLLGTWRGEGAGEYPTVEDFRYGEEMRFTHVGDPFLVYEQSSWLLEDGAPLHFERGFLRPAPDGALELVLAHPLGIVEVSEGSLKRAGTERVLDLASRIVGLTTTGDRVTALERHLTTRGDEMTYELRMATEETPLATHLRAELRRGA
jgi:hypothetical protein